MSRKSRFEYIGEKRRAYAKSGKAKRSRILDEVCETLGYTRKYVIKLLSGNIRYRERKGRGRTYGTSVLENVRRIWESVGCPCTTYFEAVAKAVEGVVPSPENLAWAEEMRAKGRENHAIATRERWEQRRAKRR